MTDFVEAMERAVTNRRTVVLPDPEQGYQWSLDRKPVNCGQKYWNDHFEAVKTANAVCGISCRVTWYVQEPIGEERV